MSRLTCEDVDRIVSDDPTLRDDGYPLPRYYRHLYFTHYVLGEPWTDAFALAHAFRDVPLSLDQMHVVADGWEDEL